MGSAATLDLDARLYPVMRDLRDPGIWAPYPLLWGRYARWSPVVLDDKKNGSWHLAPDVQHALQRWWFQQSASRRSHRESRVASRDSLTFEIPNLVIAVTWFCGREQRRGAMTSDGLLYGPISARWSIKPGARAFRYHPLSSSERRRRALSARSLRGD